MAESAVIDQLRDELDRGDEMHTARVRGQLADAGEDKISAWMRRVVALLKKASYPKVDQFEEVDASEVKYEGLRQPHTPDLEVTYALRERVEKLRLIVREIGGAP